MPLIGNLQGNLTLSLQPKTVSWFPVNSRRCSLSKSVVKSSSKSEEADQGQGGGGELTNALSNIVDKRVEELLGREENKAMLDKLNMASQRVQLAKKQLADIQRQEIEAQQMRFYVDQLQTRVSEIAECQQQVLEAREMVEEAERSLSMSMDLDNDKMKRYEERWESVKAASISAMVGSMAALPIYLTNNAIASSSPPQLLLQLGITFASCALFGVTFRYAVRTDLDNIQLKTGTCAAFAFVKGLGTLNGGPPLELNSASLLSHALDGAFLVSRDLFIFLFAAVSLDFCFKTRLVNSFPIKRSD